MHKEPRSKFKARSLVHAVGLEPTEFTEEPLIYSQVLLPLSHACVLAAWNFVLGILYLGFCTWNFVLRALYLELCT